LTQAISGKTEVRGIDQVLADLAGAQHGVVARRQLLGAGIGRAAIDQRLRSGHLLPFHRGVYAVGHRAIGIEARWMAATLAAGPAGVLSHRSAGQLWRILPRRTAVPEVTRPDRRGSRPGLIAHEGSLPADEITSLLGIPVTSVPRTLLDLAAVLKPRALEKAMDEAEVLRLTDRLSLPDLLERYPRRRGSAAARRLLRRNTVRSVTRNDFEEAFRGLLIRGRLPLPRFNADLAAGGRFFEVDCLWAARWLIVELDGRVVHGTRSAFEADRRRDRLLLAEGWRVMRVTWAQLRDEPDEIVADLRRALTLMQ
jgi:very-short-patch-repair endonuclease